MLCRAAGARWRVSRHRRDRPVEFQGTGEVPGGYWGHCAGHQKLGKRVVTLADTVAKPLHQCGAAQAKGLGAIEDQSTDGKGILTKSGLYD